MTQTEYIEILAIDLGYNRAQRNDAIASILYRKISYLDELSSPECSKVIDEFKARKLPSTSPSFLSSEETEFE